MRTLLTVSGVTEGEPIRASHLGFRLGPRINAAGRIDESARAVRLLLSPDDETALPEATDLDAFNRKRQEMERETMADVLRMAQEAGDFGDRRGIVLWSADWHPGVVGIVASRVVQHFHRPALVLSVKPDEGVAVGWLKPGGSFVCKVFQGVDEPALRGRIKARFDKVKAVRPKGTRTSSVEIFVVATGFRGAPTL